MSGKCYQCGKTKEVKMVLARYAEPIGKAVGKIEYLCKPCQRELGYV